MNTLIKGLILSVVTVSAVGLAVNPEMITGWITPFEKEQFPLIQSSYYQIHYSNHSTLISFDTNIPTITYLYLQPENTTQSPRINKTASLNHVEEIPLNPLEERDIKIQVQPQGANFIKQSG